MGRGGEGEDESGVISEALSGGHQRGQGVRTSPAPRPTPGELRHGRRKDTQSRLAEGRGEGAVPWTVTSSGGDGPGAGEGEGGGGGGGGEGAVPWPVTSSQAAPGMGGWGGWGC